MHFCFIVQMRRAAFFSPAPLLLVNKQEGGGSTCRPRVCPNSGAESFQVRTCGSITSQRRAEESCCKVTTGRMAFSFSRHLATMVSANG
ncbi:hypothetical protein CHARACLAT_017068 [Characodon lateralis]|uniref:Secreted protein n=1 Tax=Characodon lateralis TaxID=208331 RepID=A0ABU7EUW2_9TELE|nr:hypothetical protein [Characodon lateralis]